VASIVGYAVTLAAIVAVPAVLIPQESRGAYFWWRVGWAGFLAAILWAYVGGSLGSRPPAEEGERKGGGMLGAVGATAAVYALISGALLLLSALLPDTSLVNRAHLAIQIVLAAAVMVIWVYVYFSRVSGESASG
jgi:hypothetical protein